MSRVRLPASASYVRCRSLARRSASSFYYSFLLLPRRKRRAMYALYAFLRQTDDIADGDEPLDVRRARLSEWRHALREALAGRGVDPLLPALVDTAQQFEIPPAYLEAAIDGAEMDLGVCRYATALDLEHYCYYVASCVGFCCLHIWGFSNDRALVAGHKCGLAFQWTNILRDIKEDAASGRIYLPGEDLESFGYSEDDLVHSVHDDRFLRLMRFEIARVEGYYREAAELSRWLSPEGRRAFAAMSGTYRGLLEEIKRLDGDVLHEPIRLSGWRKARIAIGCLLNPGRRAKQPAASALS